MKLTPEQIRLLALHLSDYVENLKDYIEHSPIDRGDMERSAANLTEACQLRDLANEAKTAIVKEAILAKLPSSSWTPVASTTPDATSVPTRSSALASSLR